MGFSGGSVGKESSCNANPRFSPWVRKIPWRRKWQPTPVFLSGKSLGWRSLVGYSLWVKRVKTFKSRTDKVLDKEWKKPWLIWSSSLKFAYQLIWLSDQTVQYFCFFISECNVYWHFTSRILFALRGKLFTWGKAENKKRVGTWEEAVKVESRGRPPVQLWVLVAITMAMT